MKRIHIYSVFHHMNEQASWKASLLHRDFFFSVQFWLIGFLPSTNFKEFKDSHIFLNSLLSQKFSQHELSYTLYIHQDHVHNFNSEMQCTTACYKHTANILEFLWMILTYLPLELFTF